MAATNKILNHSVGASFGAGDELILSANALENAEKIAVTFANSAASTIPKGRCLKDDTTAGYKTSYTNGDASPTGLAILMHDVTLDGTGGEVIATALVTCDACNSALVLDANGAAPDTAFKNGLPLVRLV